MARFYPRRFSELAALRRVDSQRLVRFLHPHDEYLRQRGLRLPHQMGDPLDYQLLSGILMTPYERMPGELVNALYFVHEMATTDAMHNNVC